ncbi:aspartate/glutamate racemase family protein [Natronosporangium hydrolyticum]|uniref:Aspartate/glutamate racemase family protein n=1 Tax=Natronosporangium hydrolyticum TaxID=2811111 RepID=A0A895YGN4_9ACTN|nr:amino acid racemase [Natronosporangium hydrolyticum]QSB15252.1 aspartate/glutamate racemase family protein [Natronosporangium hydrolyticum]
MSLGVLGGMGPAATADFLLRLARLTPADRDQDHLPTIVYSDPRTPDRSDAILGQGPSPLPAMLRGIEFLNRAGCGLLVVPCNSAHYWYAELAAAATAPLLHIADVTADRLRALPGVTRVGLLATDGTVHAGIYQSRLAAAGIATLDLTDGDAVSPVLAGIRRMKAGDSKTAGEQLLAAGAKLVRLGAEALIIGCTDISAALPSVTELAGAPVVDTADCLARATVDTCRLNR